MNATPKSVRSCSEGECTRVHYARGLCELHYQRIKAREGFEPLPKATPQQRFWAKVDASGGPSDCWPWMASKNATGYGKFWWGGRKGYAHRAAYTFANGPIPDGLQVDHLCYRHDCCNPNHLRAVTHKQNQENRQGAQANNRTSGVRGVCWNPRIKRWYGQIRHNGETIRCPGSYRTVEEAAEAVRLKRLELFTHNDMDKG